jgi:hypothetical protein
MAVPRKHIVPKNLYRQRWTLSVCSAQVKTTPACISLRPDLLKVIHRFSGGMVYEVRGNKFLLTENIFGDYPFLLNFSLTPKKGLNFRTHKFVGLPDAVLSDVRNACEETSRTIKLPKNLHNVEVDITEHLKRDLKLPRGMKLVKGLMKIDFRPGAGAVACDCDVDGPCGYCCDTCDCNSCYNCC